MTKKITVTANHWAHGWELIIDEDKATQVRSLAKAQQQVRDYFESLNLTIVTLLFILYMQMSRKSFVRHVKRRLLRERLRKKPLKRFGQSSRSFAAKGCLWLILLHF